MLGLRKYNSKTYFDFSCTVIAVGFIRFIGFIIMDNKDDSLSNVNYILILPFIFIFS
jgi:hypothetical protein